MKEIGLLVSSVLSILYAIFYTAAPVIVSLAGLKYLLS
jgi:hypothetical protein